MVIRDAQGNLHDDNNGRFTSKSGTSDKMSELERKYNDDLPITPKNDLSKQEWALWYKAVAENKALGYWAQELGDGTAVLKVENDNAHKIVITSGTFEKPKANAVYSFSSSDELNDYIEVLKFYDNK